MERILYYKKVVISVILGLALLWLLSQGWFYEAVFGFLLVGLLPGTPIILPTWLMLLFAIAAGYWVISWLVRNPTKPELSRTVRHNRYHKAVRTQKTVKKTATKRTQPAPRRRYSRVNAS